MTVNKNCSDNDSLRYIFFLTFFLIIFFFYSKVGNKSRSKNVINKNILT